MNTKGKKPNPHIALSILAFLLISFSLIHGYLIAGKQIQRIGRSGPDSVNSSVLSDLNDRWTLHHEDGSIESITLPYEVNTEDSTVSISRNVTGIFRSNDILKFDNNRQGVIVSINNEVLYEVNTTSLTKQLSFTDYQLVSIPSNNGVAELSLTFTHKLSDHYILPEISYGSYTAASSEILHNDLITLNILEILCIVLFVALLISGYCYVIKLASARVFDLVLFIFAALLWGYTDSYLPVLSGIPQEVLGLICYFSIMTLPIPICQFVWRSCKRQYKILPIISAIGILNLILQVILSSLGLVQLQNTFYSAHVLILAVIAASLICLYKTRTKEHDGETDVLYFGLVALSFISLLSLFLYWKKGNMHYRVCMLIGILLFSLILSAYVIMHYLRMLHDTELKISEIKIQERLALTDDLTNMPNRRAFEEKLNEIEKELNILPDAVLIMLDVNGLKLVNDQYGHTAGDDLILSASKVVQNTYGSHGTCYRIGGDEFAVLLFDFSVPLATYDILFDENVAEYNKNSRWKLSIAKGCSHIVHESGQRLTISDWKQEADINMYRNKVAMTRGDTRDRAKELTDIINCIITTLEAKDVYTAAHSDRVRELSYCIAKTIGVSDSTIQNVENAANLHDIGKIGVPDYILLKPGRLTDEEYEVIKRHTVIGANIIGQAKGMQDISNIILHHHERWDGKGYPTGLSRDDIPLESRIIALADSIDAMTSKRVYRNSMSLDSCRQEIEKNSGIMYDPAITQMVLQNWSEIVNIIMLHPKRLISES